MIDADLDTAAQIVEADLRRAEADAFLNGRHAGAFGARSGAPYQNAQTLLHRERDRFALDPKLLTPVSDLKDSVDVESLVAEVADADNEKRLAQMRRVRRAAVNRLIDFVRIEQLALNGPNDRTSVEELTHDAIMKALDLYFEGRPKASPDTMSMALDTLEKIQAIKAGGKP